MYWLCQAVEKFGDVDVYTSSFRPMKATLSGLPEKTFMKMIVDASSDKVVGLHMCGDETPEILQVRCDCAIHPVAFCDFSCTIRLVV